jgi:hypothetical protein
MVGADFLSMSGPVKKTPEQLDADFIRRLASGFDGEIVATVHTWRRKLSSDGRDLHDVANIIEGGGKLTEAEMRKLYDAGYEAGLQEGESRHPVTTAASTSPTFTTWRSGCGNAAIDCSADSAISSREWSS